MTELADDKQMESGHIAANRETARNRIPLWVKALLSLWVLLTALWLVSVVAPWQFSVQTSAYRTHLYLINGVLYWQHEIIHHAHAHSFMKVGLLAYAHLLAPATRLLIVTNGVGAVGGGVVGLHGLVYSWNPLAGSGLWVSPLVLALVLLGPLAWWGARRIGRRKASSPSVRTA